MVSILIIVSGCGSSFEFMRVWIYSVLVSFEAIFQQRSYLVGDFLNDMTWKGCCVPKNRLNLQGIFLNVVQEKGNVSRRIPWTFRGFRRVGYLSLSCSLQTGMSPQLFSGGIPVRVAQFGVAKNGVRKDPTRCRVSLASLELQYGVGFTQTAVYMEI